MSRQLLRFLLFHIICRPQTPHFGAFVENGIKSADRIDLPIFEYDNPVRPLKSRFSMRYYEPTRLCCLSIFIQSRPHFPLRFHVKRAGKIIYNYKLGLSQQSSSGRGPLYLPARKANTPRTDSCVQSIIHLLEIVIQDRTVNCLIEIRLTDLRAPNDVVSHRVGK